MASGIDAFVARIGTPTQPPDAPFRLPSAWAQQLWEHFTNEAGAGSYMDGFVYLFGERAREFEPLLAHWSFLFSDTQPRWVIGRNAYGALLVLEEPESGTASRVGMIDPLEVRYVREPNLTLTSLVGRWLPMDLLPGFLDDAVYRFWRRDHPEGLAFDEALAIKQPLSLDGEMRPDNFQVEQIADYYRDTGAIYRKSLDPIAKPRPA